MFSLELLETEIRKAEELLKVNPKTKPYIEKSLESAIEYIRQFLKGIRVP